MTETYEEVSNAHTWRDPIGQWYFFLLWFVAITALFIALAIGDACMWASLAGQLYFSEENAAVFNRIFITLNQSLLPMYGICALALILLTHRTVANAHAAGAQNRLSGPLLAGFIYFMPLVGLVMPPVVLGRLWNATFGNSGPQPGGLIATWWSTTLLGTIIALSSQTANISSDEIAQRWLIVHGLGLMLRAVACICLLLVFGAIVKRQRERSR